MSVGGVDDVAGQYDGNVVEEGVDEGGCGVGAQLHVGSLDAFPAADGGAVERLAVFKPFFGVVQYDAGGNGEVVLFAFGVGKTQIDKAGFVFFYQFDNVFDGHGLLLKWRENGTARNINMKGKIINNFTPSVGMFGFELRRSRAFRRPFRW